MKKPVLILIVLALSACYTYKDLVAQDPFEVRNYASDYRTLANCAFDKFITHHHSWLPAKDERFDLGIVQIESKKYNYWLVTVFKQHDGARVEGRTLKRGHFPESIWTYLEQCSTETPSNKVEFPYQDETLDPEAFP